MSWGPCFLYYKCPSCGVFFKYAEDLIPVLGEKFGCCPMCKEKGILEKDGAITPDDYLYQEVED